MAINTKLHSQSVTPRYIYTQGADNPANKTASVCRLDSAVLWARSSASRVTPYGTRPSEASRVASKLKRYKHIAIHIALPAGNRHNHPGVAWKLNVARPPGPVYSTCVSRRQSRDLPRDGLHLADFHCSPCAVRTRFIASWDPNQSVGKSGTKIIHGTPKPLCSTGSPGRGLKILFFKLCPTRRFMCPRTQRSSRAYTCLVPRASCLMC